MKIQGFPGGGGEGRTNPELLSAIKCFPYTIILFADILAIIYLAYSFYTLLPIMFAKKLQTVVMCVSLCR